MRELSCDAHLRAAVLSLDLVTWAWHTLDSWRARRPNLIECSTEESSPEEIARDICRRADVPYTT